MSEAEVHEKAAEVLRFWFGLSPDRHFAKDAALDREIAERFGALRDAVLAAGAAGWREAPDTLLAAVILLDQFSRNIHRDSPRAYEADPLALALTLSAIERGWDEGYAPEERAFLYLPLMHAESEAMQALSVEKYTALGLPENLRFARDHAAVIACFGRYPSRNAALGRESTQEEEEYLSQPGAGW
ncbi:DUF924 domain-containing protein [Sphingomonas sp. CL5.1]|uniref:DUF924 family protein n=1 Tax=Sphingomonas sp. CL5.1 TaxID=2653203 RepID=UPI001582C213|nr:DUF924 family protein [Sphingomonas sp. CL5.1]QKS00898.1 DUF924 domain-containing protein [Sphingomonas sp. CL5.1]